MCIRDRVIGRIICISQPVCTVVDETVFGRKAVIEPVQLCLFLLNSAVRNLSLIHISLRLLGFPIWGDCHSIGAGTGGNRLPGKNEIQQVL